MEKHKKEYYDSEKFCRKKKAKKEKYKVIKSESETSLSDIDDCNTQPAKSDKAHRPKSYNSNIIEKKTIEIISDSDNYQDDCVSPELSQLEEDLNLEDLMKQKELLQARLVAFNSDKSDDESTLKKHVKEDVLHKGYSKKHKSNKNASLQAEKRKHKLQEEKNERNSTKRQKVIDTQDHDNSRKDREQPKIEKKHEINKEKSSRSGDIYKKHEQNSLSQKDKETFYKKDRDLKTRVRTHSHMNKPRQRDRSRSLSRSCVERRHEDTRHRSREGQAHSNQRSRHVLSPVYKRKGVS